MTVEIFRPRSAILLGVVIHQRVLNLVGEALVADGIISICILRSAEHTVLELTRSPRESRSKVRVKHCGIFILADIVGLVLSVSYCWTLMGGREGQPHILNSPRGSLVPRNLTSYLSTTSPFTYLFLCPQVCWRIRLHIPSPFLEGIHIQQFLPNTP